MRHRRRLILANAFMTGAMLLPATIAAWLSATTTTVRGFATAALVAALIVPAAVAISGAIWTWAALRGRSG